jgi:hypothetical protein
MSRPPVTIRLNDEEVSLLTKLAEEDHDFQDLLLRHPGVAISETTLALGKGDVADLEEYFFERCARVGFDENYMPNQEGKLLESLLGSLPFAEDLT